MVYVQFASYHVPLLHMIKFQTNLGHLVYHKKQEHYQTITNCTYWSFLGSFNNWNIIQFSQKSTPYDEFDEIHQVALDGISDNIASLVQSGKYDAINTTVTETNIFYVIMFKSEAYTLQDNTAVDGKIITSGELFVKAQYLCSMQ